MPANVETMMYFGERPWHGLGVELDHPATAEEAIIYAGLNWSVEKVPLYLKENISEEAEYQKLGNHSAIVRCAQSMDEKNRTLGVVGKRYTPLQNKDAFGFFDAIVGEGEAIYHTAGVLGQGERIWILAKLPGEIKVTDEDISEKFLLLSNSHDGTSGVQVKFTPIRVVCQNTLSSALSRGNTVNIRHTQNIDYRIKEAHKLLNITNTYYDQLENTFQQFAKRQVTSQQLTAYIENIFPNARDSVTDNIIDLFENGKGNNLKGVKGSLWAAYNGVVEYIDHNRPRVKEANKLKSIWFGGGALMKQRAFNEAIDVMKAA